MSPMTSRSDQSQARHPDRDADGASKPSGRGWARRAPLVSREWRRTARSRTARASFGAAAFVETLALPLPIDLVALPLVLADRRRAWRLVLVGTAGSALGALALYTIGAVAFATLGEWLLELWGLEEAADAMRARVVEHGLAALAAAAFLPHVFKVAALLCGAAVVPVWAFFGVVVAARGLRFALVIGVLAAFSETFARLHKACPRTLWAAGGGLAVASGAALIWAMTGV